MDYVGGAGDCSEDLGLSVVRKHLTLINEDLDCTSCQGKLEMKISNRGISKTIGRAEDPEEKFSYLPR